MGVSWCSCESGTRQAPCQVHASVVSGSSWCNVCDTASYGPHSGAFGSVLQTTYSTRVASISRIRAMKVRTGSSRHVAHHMTNLRPGQRGVRLTAWYNSRVASCAR